MKLLEKYIAKTVLLSIGLVTLMLAGLQVFILFVNQLDNLGKGDYNIIQAAWFVCLQMPYQVYLFFPMASLLGCLIGLGVLANNHELIVMRASGMSIMQVTQAVLKAAMLLIILVTVLSETILPKMVGLANDKRTEAISGGQALRTSKGVWIRHQNDFIHIGSIAPGNVLEAVLQFHFDKHHHLLFTRKMNKIKYTQGVWIAQNVVQTKLYANHTQVESRVNLVWDIPLQPTILSISGSEPDEMTLEQLYRYIRMQQKSHQTALNYQLAFWQRIIQPITTVVMMMLAIPFIFGPLRSSAMGSKLLTGATVGFGFHMINRFLGSMSQVYQLPPELAALLPTCLFSLVGLYLMKRVK